MTSAFLNNLSSRLAVWIAMTLHLEAPNRRGTQWVKNAKDALRVHSYSESSAVEPCEDHMGDVDSSDWQRAAIPSRCTPIRTLKRHATDTRLPYPAALVGSRPSTATSSDKRSDTPAVPLGDALSSDLHEPAPPIPADP